MLSSGNQARGIGTSVQPVSTAVPSLQFGATNGQVQLAWPQDHTGWVLLAQTNALSAGLGTNWAAVPNSSGTNQVIFPINTTNGSVFFRLSFLR